MSAPLDPVFDPWGGGGGAEAAAPAPLPSLSAVAPPPQPQDTETYKEMVSVKEHLARLELDSEEIVEDEELTASDKSEQLQLLLFSVASNGNLDATRDLLDKRDKYGVDMDATDDNGNSALNYAACFGHDKIVQELVAYGANVESEDKFSYTPLMWAVQNGHFNIVRDLLDAGADPARKTGCGKNALGFVTDGSTIHLYLKGRGLVSDNSDSGDFYQSGVMGTEDGADEIIMESAYNFDVRLDKLQGDSDEDKEEEEDDMGALEDSFTDTFNWSRCLPDQMFVFATKDIPQILDTVVSNIEPQRNHTQKPIPANMLFLCVRYAHYTLDNPDVVAAVMNPALGRIKAKVEAKATDMVTLAFWLSNVSLLLYYFRRDAELQKVEYTKTQADLATLCNDIHVLICQDCERRLEPLLDTCILDHETIPGLDAINYKHEWKLFKKKHKEKSHQEEMEEQMRPLSPHRKALPSPRNVTSILSSVLFILDLFEIHPILTQQIVSQLLFWLGAVLFNRVLTNRRYLSRSRAMQVRLNVSAVEDWARQNDRKYDMVDEFGNGRVYPSIAELCRTHLASLVQMLQWLQCFTGFGDDFTNVIATLQQLTALNPFQLLHVAKKYRPEVDENGLSKDYKKYLQELAESFKRRVEHRDVLKAIKSHDSAKTAKSVKSNKSSKSTKSEDAKEGAEGGAEGDAFETTPPPQNPAGLTNTSQLPPEYYENDDGSEPNLLLDPTQLLTFQLPSLAEMIITWGAVGGLRRKRARRYEPVLPVEFLDSLDFGDDVGGGGGMHDQTHMFTVSEPQLTSARGWEKDTKDEVTKENDEFNPKW
ncbi:Dilute domain-containing protein [Yarrowia sp. B02]|nr:Dilute domain-containing protein [Yarrowia sp. B02]